MNALDIRKYIIRILKKKKMQALADQNVHGEIINKIIDFNIVLLKYTQI